MNHDTMYHNKCNSLQRKILQKETPPNTPELIAYLTIFVTYYLRKTFK